MVQSSLADCRDVTLGDDQCCECGDERGSYDQTSASLALDRTLNFFEKHMGFDPDSTVVMPR